MIRLGNKIVVAVKGIIVHNNEVLIIKRADNDEAGAGIWEFVGGKIEFGEELEYALTREIIEEVGIDVDIEKLLYATTFKTDPTRQVVIIAYKCHAKNSNVKLSEEHSEYTWVTKQDLRRLLSSDILSDMDNNNVFSSIFED